MRPARITATWSAMYATTAMLWVMNRKLTPSSRCSSRSRLRICACTLTSSAEVGSSQTISFGCTAKARAFVEDLVQIAEDDSPVQLVPSSPGIDHRHAQALEVPKVARRQRRASRLGDAGDLGVANIHRAATALSVGCQQRGLRRGL